MSAYPNHSDVRPFYVQPTDPGAVGSGVSWVDTSIGPPHQLKIRNFADDGWDGINSNYIHEQLVPEDIWSIIHNMNKFPSVVITDDLGFSMEGLIEYVDLDTIIIHFNSDVTGTAVLN